MPQQINRFLREHLDPKLRQARILVVDDDPNTVRLIHHIFADRHEVFMATSGEQALAFCNNTPPDLILLDVLMPEMDGLEVCRQLKADDNTAEIPVIFVTAANQTEEFDCWEAGGVDFVAKPINTNALINRVRVHLSLKFQSDIFRELAYIDGLSGVPNRRAFDERLEMEWRRCARAGTPLSLLILDVDNFKAYNDTYGHQLGDDCLRQLASSLEARMQRSGDIVARYGGEEFAIVMPDTPLAGAVAVARIIEQAVRELNIPHEASATANVVTVSIGVAADHPQLGSSHEALLQAVDNNLYRAKALGRATICSGE